MAKNPKFGKGVKLKDNQFIILLVPRPGDKGGGFLVYIFSCLNTFFFLKTIQIQRALTLYLF
ncbi:hypothetical protein HanIR_Chr01g0023121 [Helianthus annuus]|nr:hypothetical protein HanIR_Chr01g0023121 [Helianthus annuus]